MPLVDLIEERGAPLLLRHLFADGDPGALVGALAQVPELCRVTLPFVGAALGASAVPVRHKEIAIIRTSADLACRFCTDTHTVVGAGVGLSTAELRALRHELPIDDVFTDQTELALIDWIDALAIGTGPVDPLVAARAKLLLGDHRLVEVTVTVGATMMLNRFATALDLPTSTQTDESLDALGFAPLAAAPATPLSAAPTPTATREEVPA